jgi:hypothetical protein
VRDGGDQNDRQNCGYDTAREFRNHKDSLILERPP